VAERKVIVLGHRIDSTAWRWLNVPRCVSCPVSRMGLPSRTMDANASASANPSLRRAFRGPSRSVVRAASRSSDEHESVRHAHQAGGDFFKSFRREAGVHFIFRLVAAVAIGRPVLRQLSEMRDLSQRAGFGLFFFVFLANCFRNPRRVDAGAFSIKLPKRRMIFDALVQEG